MNTMPAYRQRGISLVELLVVVVIIGFSVLLIANIPNSINLIGEAKDESLAREIAVKQIEDERNIQYINLANGTQSVSDARLRLLAGGSGTILIEDCSSSVCTNGESVKQVTVTINWKKIKAHSVVIKTLIGQGGVSQ